MKRLLLLICIAVLALACHFGKINVQVTGCEKATIGVNWYGANRLYKLVLYVDGIEQENVEGNRNLSITHAYNGKAGEHVAKFVVYEWKRGEWVLRSVSKSTTFELEPCPCKLTNIYEYTLGGNYKCTLVTTPELGGGIDKIPPRFLNYDGYTKKLCQFCDYPWYWDGTWSVRKKTTCDPIIPCTKCEDLEK